jgi:monoamine oxidase
VSVKWDVIVVGAGAAGLACAASLTAAGRSVLVLEARARLGGRILTLRTDGDPPVEAGAQVVHGESAATWDTLRAGPLPTRPMPTDDPFAIVAGGRRYEPDDLRGIGLAFPWVVEQQLVQAAAPDPPVEQLAQVDGTPLHRQVMLGWLSQVWCAHPGRLSAAGMAEVRADWRAGYRNFVLPAGYDGVVEQLARGLELRLSAPVDTIAWGGHEGVIVSAGGREWHAPRVVVTVPPPVVAAGGLTFDPPLPEGKATASARIAVGDAITVTATSSEPASRSGWALAVDEPAGFWRVQERSRIVQGSFKGPGTATARTLLADPRRLLEPVAAAFPWLGPVPDAPLVAIDWGRDPYSRGGYCYPTAGSADAQRVWAEPIEDTLFFAGDATRGTRHPGTVHGAIESGLRVAAELAVPR